MALHVAVQNGLSPVAAFPPVIHDPSVRTKAIASPGEIAADRILRRILEKTPWLVYANVSLQSVLQREERLSPAAFSMLTRGSFDFVVCDDQDYHPIFALELDGFRHSDSRQVARDLLKNAFCAKAGLPLLRIGVNDLREREEYSVLEWLVGAFAASEQELEDELEAVEEGSEDLEDVGPEDDPGEPALGEDGFQFEAEHPFPDNALLAGRLLERYGVFVTESGLLDRPEEAPYLLKVNWPGRQPPQLRDGLVSRFVVSERDFSLFPRGRPAEALLSGIGRAEFAFEHKFPPRSRVGRPREQIDFPWDPWGVAAELALFDALRQAMGWAARRMARGARRRGP